MMQQINLYQPSFRQVRQFVSIGVMVSSVVLFLLLFAGYYGYISWQLQQQTARVQLIETRVAEQQQRVAEMEKQFPVRTKSALLEKQLAAFEQTRAGKQQILNMLNSGVVGNNDGFSAYLEGMARRRIDNLWLSNIVINGGGERMRIEGSTLKADLLPKYIQQLSMESAFSGREFAIFSMSRSGKGNKQIDFSLNSGAEEKGSKK